MTDRPCPDAKAAEIAERLAKYGEADTFTSPSWEDVETLLADRDKANRVIRGLLALLATATLLLDPEDDDSMVVVYREDERVKAARGFVEEKEAEAR